MPPNSRSGGKLRLRSKSQPQYSWSHMPRTVMHRIQSFLSNPGDILLMRSVCRTWGSHTHDSQTWCTVVHRTFAPSGKWALPDAQCSQAEFVDWEGILWGEKRNRVKCPHVGCLEMRPSIDAAFVSHWVAHWMDVQIAHRKALELQQSLLNDDEEVDKDDTHHQKQKKRKNTKNPSSLEDAERPKRTRSQQPELAPPLLDHSMQQLQMHVQLVPHISTETEGQPSLLAFCMPAAAPRVRSLTFDCVECDASFGSLIDLRFHCAHTHLADGLFCKLCNHVVQSRSAFYRHLHNKHKKKAEKAAGKLDSFLGGVEIALPVKAAVADKTAVEHAGADEDADADATGTVSSTCLSCKPSWKTADINRED